MRLLSVTVLGAALVAAGLAVPATGEATSGDRNKIAVQPKVARPGQRVDLSVPRCPVGPQRHWAASPAFTRQVTLEGKADRGHGTATINRNIKPGTYQIVAHCGTRSVTGEIRISTKLAWPAILPTALTDDGLR